MTTQLATVLQDALGPDYRIEQELEGGGMSRVFLATDLRHNRRVVVKVLSPELASDTSSARFKREIELTVRLQHPHILPILTSGAHGDTMYYVSPFIPGESLKARIARDGKLPLADIVKFLRDVSGALAFAHQRGIVHRDVKPGNILLAEGHAILADFGIARAVATNATPITVSGVVPGTPAYMAPGLPSDQEADWYALGVVGAEMLTGRLVSAHVSRRQITEWRGQIAGDQTHELAAVVDVVHELMNRGANAPAIVARDLELRLSTGTTRVWRIGSLTAFGGVAAAAVITAALVFSNRRAADPDAVAIVPLASAGNVRALAADARFRLAEWQGVRVVDLGAADAVLDANRAVARAKQAGAGRVVILDRVRADATDWWRARVLDTRSDSLLKSTTIAAADLDGPRRTPNLRRFVSDFIRDGRELPTFDASQGKPDIRAWRQYDAGRSALSGWNLRLADSTFRAVLARDPSIAPAHLWLAQTLTWLDTANYAEARRNVQAALASHAMLSPADSEYAVALSELLAGDFHGACEAYSRLALADSANVRAWIGLGDCRAFDRRVVRSPQSSTRWAFESSYHAAAQAYERAGRYPPPRGESPFRGWLLGRLANVLFFTTNRVRFGFSTARDSAFLGAFPFLDHDTLAFAPHPMADFATRRGDPPQVLIQRAVARNRHTLRAYAEDWVRGSPDDAAAYDSLATWSELSEGFATVDGKELSVLEIVRRAERLATSEVQRLRLGVSETRQLVKAGQFQAAHDVAMSLVKRGLFESAGEVPGSVGIFALLGRMREAMRLREETAEGRHVYLRSGEVWDIPPGLRSNANALLAYSAFAVHMDSIHALSPRVLGLIDRLVPDSARRAQVRSVLVAGPLSLCGIDAARLIPPDVAPPEKSSELVMAAARGDFSGVRVRVSQLDSIDAGKLPGNGLPLAFRRVNAVLAIADTAGAIQGLDEMLQTIPLLDPDFLLHVEHAAALVRTMRLRAELAQRGGDDRLAATWFGNADALWADADADLREAAQRTATPPQRR